MKTGLPMSEIGAFNPFDLPHALVEPAIRMLRTGNTLLDAMFYDVNVLSDQLRARGDAIDVDAGGKPPSDAARITDALRDIDLGALSDPEGSILIIDTKHAPYITVFRDVPSFLVRAHAQPVIETVSITGVGGSGLGSAGFAWNISAAIGEPVAAIVPGYGLADVMQQALGGWFIGMHGWMIKQTAQNALALGAPALARIGRGLLATAPGHHELNDAPVFTRGSGSADVLHAILDAAPRITRLFGHSKGALVIESALAGQAPSQPLNIVTFGCPIGEDVPGARYEQFLGLLDWLGALNAWGNAPEKTPLACHSTNTRLPLSMGVKALASRGSAGLRRDP